MSKLDKNELLEGVRNIIAEGFNRDVESLDGTKKFNIHRYVTGLIEEGHKNPDLMTYLLKYDNALNNGVKDFTIFEQFGQGLTQYAKGNAAVKNVIKQMNETLATDGASLVGFQLIEKIEDPYIKDDVTKAFNRYIADKCADTRDELVEALEPLLMVSDPIAMKLNLLITEDSSMSANFIHTDFINEAENKALQEKIQAQRDKKTMDNIFEKVQRYIDEKLEDDEKSKLTEKEEFCLNAIANNQGLNLSEHINNIRHSDAGQNERLMDVLNLYSNAINNGAYEERLYETFLQNVSKFNYLLPVSKAMKSITEKVDNKREEITLTKILEEMKDDHSSFIYVDLIQEDVARYVKEPNAINRVQLRNALMPYASDPYINEMFNVLYADNTRRANELTEKALNIKDQINIIRENATVSSIYTPVQYVRDNECIFNVNGQFYVKKGNNIAVLDEKYVDQLDERFVELCQLVNDPHVEINEDSITLNGNDKFATIYEGYVDIHGHKESKESLRNLREMCMKYDDYDTNFYIMCSCLLENFNNIAKIDWAKHVTLNDNHNISADLFKLDEQIYIATHNDAIAQHTFYRNVNPIFCKNKLNEHMGINVSSLFSDLLPSQDKIILQLNETKNSYEDSIEKYENMIKKLKDALKDASEENKGKLEKAVSDAEDKLNDIKVEYKEWQKQADEVTGKETDEEETDDDSVIREEPNEPVDADDVNPEDFSMPLESEEGEYENTDDFDTEESDESMNVTDDEFAKYLGSDDEDDTRDFDTDDSDIEDETEDDEQEGDEAEYNDEIDTEDTDDMTDVIGDDEEDVQDDEEFKEVSFDDENQDDDTLSDEDVFDTDDDSEEQVDSKIDDENPIENIEAEYKETTDDSDELIDNDEDEDEDEATDEFGGDTEDPLSLNNDTEIDLPNNAPKAIGDKEPYESKFSYKIADVMFDENVKENKKEKSGSVIVIVPMVDGTGKKYVENKTIEFYLDDNNMPILDNEPMTNELYAAVVDAIKSHPDYTDVCETGEVANEETTVTAALRPDDEEDEDWEAEYLRDGNDEDREQYSQEDSDDTDDMWSYMTSDNGSSEDEDDTEDTSIGFNADDFDDEDDAEDNDPENNENEEDVVIPAYKLGNTEVELPAASEDGTLIPEYVNTKKSKKNLKESIKITPIFKTKSGKRFF